MEEKQLGLEPTVFTETRPSLQETVERLSKMRSTLKDLVIEEPATSEMFRIDPPRQSLYRSLRRYYSDKEKNQMIDERMIKKLRQDLDEFINQDPYHVNILNFLPAELIFDLYSDPIQKEKFTGYLSQLINTASKKNFALFIKSIPSLIDEGIIPPDQYFSFLLDSDSYVRGAAVKAIPELIEKEIITTKENFPDYILDMLLKDPDPYVRGAFVKVLPILIDRGIIQYPLNNPDLYLPQGIAQNFTPLVLAQAIKETNQKINLVLKEKKLDDKVLPGLLILGSAIKGYWLPSSDIDWGLIVDSTVDKDVLETAIEKLTSSLNAQGISLCRCHVIYVDNLKNGDISAMDLNEEKNDAVFNLFIGQWVGNTDIRNLRNSLIRKFLNKHPEEKTKILDHMVDNLVTGNLIDKGIKRRFGKEEVDDTYKKIASLLFVSKIGLPGDS